MEMSYTQEFKDMVVSRVLSGEMTKNVASQQFRVALSTIYLWLREAESGAKSGYTSTKLPKSLKEKDMKKLDLPRGISYLDAHRAVVARDIMSESDFGAYCREQGILASDVALWASWFEANPVACNGQDLSQAEKCIQQHSTRIKQLEKELAQKDKALSDTATMLVLAKKAEAIWGIKGG